MKNSFSTTLIISAAVLTVILIFSCSQNDANTQQVSSKNSIRQNDKQVAQPNHLIHEKSPYLLQHAHNPVDWYPWGEAAFEKARKEDKPIFLSIGYSTCHWCHVMAHESFEDATVAALMNDAFISIKVDREERPDIDNIYMTVCQMMTGSGGWPLTIIMTPDKKPFFAATYIPKENRYGRTGLVELIPRIKEHWLSKRGEVVNAAEQITANLQQAVTQSGSSGAARLEKALLDTTFQQLSGRFDATNGGFGPAPKFPTPHNLLFLLRYWQRTQDDSVLDMVEKTLQAMRKGGIYDHVGFGFHRYSTDAEWLTPHFEKMLYDQAMLLMAYTETFLATGDAQYARTAREIASYVLRDMTAPGGGFSSAEDADSEGEEGLFSLWSTDEVRRILGANDAEMFINIYNLETDGNFPEGRKTRLNIPHLRHSFGKWAADYKIAESDLIKKIETFRRKLFEVREKRIHPHKDDKILTDWNGMMIAALAKAGRALNEPGYLRAAEKATQFTLATMREKNGRLLHRFRDGEASQAAYIDDYAFFIWGLQELYESTFDSGHLQAAITLQQILVDHYWDDQNGAFFLTADDGEAMLVRQKKFDDGAIPSGNSVAMLNLVRLGRMTGNTAYEKMADKLAQVFIRSGGYPTMFMAAAGFALGPSYEVVIAGDLKADDTQMMLRALHNRFIPNMVILHRPPGQSAAIVKLAPFTKAQEPIRNRATAYVCQNYACNLPTTEIVQMLKLLR